jgi:hypothetical protein
MGQKKPRIWDTRIGQSGSAIFAVLASMAELLRMIRPKKQP